MLVLKAFTYRMHKRRYKVIKALKRIGVGIVCISMNFILLSYCFW